MKGIVQHWPAVVFRTHVASVEDVLNSKMKGTIKKFRDFNSLLVPDEMVSP